MSDDHDPLLERLASGELDLDDDLVARRRADDPAFDRAARELVTVRRALDVAGAVDRELLDRAVDEASPEDRRRVEAALRANLGARRGRASRFSLFRRLAMLAAGVLVAVAWYQLRTPAGAPDRTLLGGDACILEPNGRVAAFERVRLDYDALAAARSVRTTVRAADDGEILFERDELGTGTWSLSETERERWNDEGAVRVRVEVVHRSGDEETFSAEASSR